MTTSIQAPILPTLRAQLTAKVQSALAHVLAHDPAFASVTTPTIGLMRPKQAAHGDWSCTAALGLAKQAKLNPRILAAAIQKQLGTAEGLLEKTEIAGPGYLNLYVCADAWRDVLKQIIQQENAFIHSDRGQGERILLEYVSANPTGPLHVAHGRGAVTGDVVARLMDVAGFDVEREYYINDLGHQTDVLARSVFIRYQELHGRQVEHPEDFYPGDYVADIAQTLSQKYQERLLEQPESVWLETIRDFGIAAMLVRIKQDLNDFGVQFDHFVSERELTERIGLEPLLARLDKLGHTYREDGKLWFRTTSFGDDKDRVIVREDGRPTYFASDIAYHDDKLRRGFDRLINVWGADHGGYLTRVKAGLAALGHDPEKLHVIFIQMVSLTRDGEAVRMGKRLGTAVWLKEVIDEAGRDATRYLFLQRRADAQMDFDITLATKKSIENPVFYAQMGHARLASIARRAQAENIATPGLHTDLTALDLPEELALLRVLSQAPDVVGDAAESMEPHQVIHYVQNLIAQFHSYYTQYKATERVISDDVNKTQARLLLCHGLQLVLGALLNLLGVDAPEQMYLNDAISQDEVDSEHQHAG